MKRAALGLALLAVVGLAGGGLAVWVALGRLEPVDAAATTALPFTVVRGQGLRQVANALEHEGLVRDADAIVLLSRLWGPGAVVKAGEYEISPAWSGRQVLEHLVAGRVRTYPIVLPEGRRATEIADSLARAGLADRDAFLAVVYDPAFAASLGVQAASLEGYLYPETYRIPRDMPPEDLVRLLVDHFEAAWRQIAPQAKDLPLSKQQIVTLASIVEKETAEPSERPLIAAVFLNRLQRGMRLETDPTVIYGIADFDGNLRKKHLLDESNPYNTYKIVGLPPGPIANPGIQALQAVVEPAESDYLYFVSKNDGTHYFSKTYREHVNAVNRYQKHRRRSPKQ